MDEDGKRVLREQSVDEVVELLVEDHLSDDVYGDGVEDNDVEDRWRVKQEVVAEGVRSGGCGGRDDCGVRAGVLLKGGEMSFGFLSSRIWKAGRLRLWTGLPFLWVTVTSVRTTRAWVRRVNGGGAGDWPSIGDGTAKLKNRHTAMTQSGIVPT